MRLIGLISRRRRVLLAALLLVSRGVGAQVIFTPPAPGGDSVRRPLPVTRLGQEAGEDAATVDAATVEAATEDTTAWPALPAARRWLHAAGKEKAAPSVDWSALPHHLPLKAVRLSSSFGYRHHPLRGGLRHHDGIDLAAPAGAAVYATAPGRVERVALAGGLGLAVFVRHAHGLVTVYGHLGRCRVRQGQAVRRGTPVGEVGTSGLSTGPHLHYALLFEGLPVDPLWFARQVRRRVEKKGNGS